MTYIPLELRRLVVQRAGNRCEYCRLHQKYHYLPYEPDRIISEKHRGETSPDNLCLACFECNRYKGSNIGSMDLETKAFTGLYNPRTMIWTDHFQLANAVIVPLTPEGRITEFLLRLNIAKRTEKRTGLIKLGRYP